MKAQIIESIKDSVSAALKAGQTIEINYGLPYIAIKRGEDDEYFFQGDEAAQMIDENENSDLAQTFSIEDLILWQAQGW